MTPAKILFVDDEAMALKYFERLVNPLAPVITAGSVEEGRVLLKAQGAEVAVLVCDQRMPGEHGNELLRHAREYYPHVVRMLITAYSDIGDAIEAINSGEIYRYINKPWEIESLRADLKNALDLAQLRSERDSLIRDKLLAQQSHLRSSRLSALLMLGAAVHPEGHEQALYRYAQAALLAVCTAPNVEWHRWDHADLLEAEARRGAGLAIALRKGVKAFESSPDSASALSGLAQVLGGELQEDGVRFQDSESFSALLSSPVGESPPDMACTWLAWLLWQRGLAELQKTPDGAWMVRHATAATLPVDWLADYMERLAPT